MELNLKLTFETRQFTNHNNTIKIRTQSDIVLIISTYLNKYNKRIVLTIVSTYKY